MKKLFAVVMMFMVLVTGVFGADKSFEKVQKNGKFIVGLDATFAPMDLEEMTEKLLVLI